MIDDDDDVKRLLVRHPNDAVLKALVDRLRELEHVTAEPEGHGPLRRMIAEVLFLDPADVNAAAAKFTDLGFNFEPLPDRFDECGPTVWARVVIYSRLDDRAFMDWVRELTDQYGGDVYEAGEDRPPPTA